MSGPWDPIPGISRRTYRRKLVRDLRKAGGRGAGLADLIEDGGGADPFTADLVRSLLGAPGKEAILRARKHDASGGHGKVTGDRQGRPREGHG